MCEMKTIIEDQQQQQPTKEIRVMTRLKLCHVLAKRMKE